MRGGDRSRAEIDCHVRPERSRLRALRDHQLLARRGQVGETQTLTGLHHPIKERSATGAEFDPISRAGRECLKPESGPLALRERFAPPRHGADRGKRRQKPRPASLGH
jgi:hypothetical protein